MNKYPTITEYLQNRIDELEGEIKFVNLIIESVKKDRKDAEIYKAKLANYESTLFEYNEELAEFKSALYCLKQDEIELGITSEPAISISSKQPDRFRQFVGGNDIDFGVDEIN